MGKASPGPWKAVRIPAGNPLVPKKLAVMGQADLVLVTHTFDGWEAEANIRLMAAAPDMLEALEALLLEAEELSEGEGCDHSVGICWCSYFRVLDRAREAIAKAKGEEVIG